MNIPDNVEWVVDLIPDLSLKIDQFMVDTVELDDELIEVFMAEVLRLTGELQDGLERKDFAILRMAAHSIKGMGGTMGLPEISVIGLEIEDIAKDERLSDIRPLVDGMANWLATFD